MNRILLSSRGRKEFQAQEKNMSKDPAVKKSGAYLED